MKFYIFTLATIASLFQPVSAIESTSSNHWTDRESESPVWTQYIHSPSYTQCQERLAALKFYSPRHADAFQKKINSIINEWLYFRDFQGPSVLDEGIEVQFIYKIKGICLKTRNELEAKVLSRLSVE
ncbi:hypothetical protein [Lelliottia wanjuensis]|uniref:hypothetical protein n=1 Tax=Lelliottia wanjuensis TaxID=3050585 RepID=UPI00254B5005|nr:hypothetical protein [Lelliottia sp. V104_15]MDK9605794.1 hypothetical protein [Lelliottia sp. V104_15]